MELVAEAKGAAGLIEAGAAPVTGGEDLIEEPVVDEEVQGGIGGFDIDAAELALPELPDFFEGLAGTIDAGVTAEEVAGFV